MRCKWYFRNESLHVIYMESPKRFTYSELFLSKNKRNIFYILPGYLKKFNLNKDKSVGRIIKLANDNIVIKDKGSTVGVWDRYSYLKEPNRQLIDSSIYKRFSRKIEDHRRNS